VWPFYIFKEDGSTEVVYHKRTQMSRKSDSPPPLIIDDNVISPPHDSYTLVDDKGAEVVKVTNTVKWLNISTCGDREVNDEFKAIVKKNQRGFAAEAQAQLDRLLINDDDFFSVMTNLADIAHRALGRQHIPTIKYEDFVKCIQAEIHETGSPFKNPPKGE
jgi:hypothetical protein